MTCLEVVGVAPPLRALAPWIHDELVECIVTCKLHERDVLASSAPDRIFRRCAVSRRYVASLR